MLFTAAAIVALPVILFRSLQNGFYVLHIAAVVGAAYLLQQQLGEMPPLAHKTISIAIILHLLSINSVTFIIYAFDKRAAKRGTWRVSERTLHSFALIGGTPAAFIAQKILRHKNRKQSFRWYFWFILCVQIAALIALSLSVR